MKTLFKSAFTVAIMFALLHSVPIQAQTKTQKGAYLDSILSQMIPLNDKVSMSKFPVSVGEFMTHLELFDADNKALALPSSETSTHAQTQIEKVYELWYLSSFLESLKSYPKNGKYIKKLPMTGLQDAIIFRFLNTLAEIYAVKYPGKRVSFRLPTINEWEQVSQKNPLLENAGKRSCNFLEIPQSWIHLNTRTQVYEVVYPYSIMFSYAFNNNPIELKNRDAYPPNAKGFYDLYGNAAEMMFEENQTRGGFCISSGYDLLNSEKLRSDIMSSLLGFRIVMVIEK